MTVAIFTERGKVYECHALNIDDALNAYIREILRFQRGFHLDEQAWNAIIDDITSGIDLKIKLINGLCKAHGYRIVKINTDHTAAYPLTYTDSIRYTKAADGTYATVMTSLVQGDVIIKPYYNGVPVTHIGPSAFKGKACSSVVIPTGILNIGAHAFEGAGIESVVIPRGVTCIEDYTFKGCSNLEFITIPKSMAVVGEGAFDDCPKLSTINYEGTEADWANIDFYQEDYELIGNVPRNYSYNYTYFS